MAPISWERYLWEYHLFDLAVFAALVGISCLVGTVATPYCRPFRWSDETINYPLQRQETFPNYSLVIMGILVFPFFVLFIRLVARGGPLIPWCLAHLWALGLQLSIVSIIKVYAGRLRPDFLSRLKAEGYSPGASVNLCEEGKESSFLREGRLSFPSGHSSTSFTVSVILTLFLMAHLRPFSGKRGSFTRVCISLSPMVLAVICSVSRTRDFRHNFDDIVAGGLIGTGCAILSFFIVFHFLPSPEGLCVAHTRWSDMTELERQEAAEYENLPIAVRSL